MHKETKISIAWLNAFHIRTEACIPSNSKTYIYILPFPIIVFSHDWIVPDKSQMLHCYNIAI